MIWLVGKVAAGVRGTEARMNGGVLSAGRISDGAPVVAMSLPTGVDPRTGAASAGASPGASGSPVGADTVSLDFMGLAPVPVLEERVEVVEQAEKQRLAAARKTGRESRIKNPGFW